MAVLFLMTVLVLCQCSAQNLKIDIGNTVQQHDLNKGTAEFQAPVALQWGIADTSTNVGKIFNFAIPSDAFRGTIQSIKVTEAGKASLPNWLMFDEKSQQLKGIPTPADIGDNYLEVITTGPQNSQAKDVFSIKVVTETPPTHVPAISQSSDGKPQTVRCKREQPETAATIIVDADMMTMSPADRLDLINMLTDHLNLASDMMKMIPLGEKEVFDKSALVSGQGDSKTLVTPGTMLSWLVGCGSVMKDHMNILQKVEESAASGKMKRSVGHSVIGWHVTNTALQEKPKRRRRAVVATATVVDTPSPPTKLPDTVVTDIKSSETTAQLTRTMPVMETSYTQVQPTKTVIMPSASPTFEVTTTEMMTKTTTTSTPKPAVVTTAPITPTPSPSPPVDKSEIMPTKSMTVTDAPTKVVTPQPEPENPNCPDDGKSRPPMVTGAMEEMIFQAGQESQYNLPEDLFFDCVDGKTKDLSINLFGNETDVLPKTHWVELKGRKTGNYRIVGFPMNKDQGKKMYSLKAQNNFGLLATYVVKMVVKADERLSGEPSHKISMTFDTAYDKFTNAKIKEVTESLALVMFGTQDPNAITVLDIQPGSVVYSWTNNRLPTDSCPAKEVSEMMNKFVNEDGTVNEDAKSKFPFPLNEVQAIPAGACVGNEEFPGEKGEPEEPPKPETPEPGKPTSEPTDPGKKEYQEEEEKEIWLTTVVPAVVIVVLLIIFLVIACVLYRKKRKGKMSLEDKNNLVKGAPVIFPDEYDEKPNDASKPLIMDEEKPPMPPPQYTRGSSENSKSSHESNQGEEYEMDTDINSPLYQPPPPVTSTGSNKQPRPHMQPAHRNPAPYVPP